MKKLLLIMLLAGLCAGAVDILSEEQKPSEVFPGLTPGGGGGAFTPPPVLKYYWTPPAAHKTYKCLVKITVQVNSKVYVFYPKSRVCTEWVI